ncbi:down syndrome cell adhesion molecule [Caerostris darwini]|uniref:Down syndrome cell adhesion molecule n=1 Tax=Caerostris darwini TaxID=1538125 RepID=A0AAV4V620_9ARAC|nr:down syndrome cell adhesion molecule [Caerostris darwini]
MLVVQQKYAVDVYDEFVVKGNTAVLKCHVPGLVQDYVTVTSWVRDGSFVIRPTALAGDRFSIFLTGELHIRRVDHSDGMQQYRCETRHRLTGETVLSTTAGRLLITDTYRDTPPHITDSKRLLRIPEGETLEVPCASQGIPLPTYEWFRKESRDRLTPLQIGNRLLQLDGTLVVRETRVEDSGHYICKVHNTVGSDSAETEILVTVSQTHPSRSYTIPHPNSYLIDVAAVHKAKHPIPYLANTSNNINQILNNRSATLALRGDSSISSPTPPRTCKPAQLPPPHQQILGCILNTQRANIRPTPSTVSLSKSQKTPSCKTERLVNKPTALLLT